MPIKPVERIRSRIREIRGVRGQRIRGQQIRVGGGALIERARERVESAAQKIKERKPDLVPRIREWKPGTRIQEVLAPQTQTNYYGGVMDRPGMAVEVEKEQKIFNHRNISVEW